MVQNRKLGRLQASVEFQQSHLISGVGLKPIEKNFRLRWCKECHKKLSIYNLSDHCFVHQGGEAQKKKDDALDAAFERRKNVRNKNDEKEKKKKENSSSNS